jgi:hypothetical protein
MGGDGGSIPNRVDMVKTKGYTTSSHGSMGGAVNGIRRISLEHLDPREVRKTRMTTCALSGERLTKPVVACRAGYLFNKEQVLTRLLDKKMPEEFSHISALKDILELTNFPGACPITGRDLNDGVTRSEAMWPCGCVIAEKALARVQPDETCVSCSSKIELRTKLAPEGDDLNNQLEKAMELRYKKKRVDDKKDNSKSGESKRLKSTTDERESVLKQYKTSAAYREIFHPS